MAESVIGITEGSGKFGHTFQRVIGANTVEDGVVLLGEQYLAGYIANFSAGGAAVSTATGTSHPMQVMAGTTLKVRIRRIEVIQAGLATAAALTEWRLVRLVSAGTGGTVQIVTPLDGTDAGPGATCMSLPTVKGTLGPIITFAQPYFMQTAGASAQLNQPSLVWDFDRAHTKPLIIAAGTANGIAVVNQSAIAGATAWVNVWLDESNF